MYPPSKEQYRKDVFDPRLLSLYEREINEIPTTKDHRPATPRKNHSEDAEEQPVVEANGTPAPVPPTSTPQSSVGCSFEQLLCESFTKPPSIQPSGWKRPVNRRINVNAQVLTMDEVVRELERKEEEKSRPKKRKAKEIEIEETDSDDELMGLNVICDDSEDIDLEEEEEIVDIIPHFNGRNYTNLKSNIAVEKYFIIAFGNIPYVGRVTSIAEDQIAVKFLERKPGETYDWPKKDKVEYVNWDQFIFGPIKIKGHLPFHIPGVTSVMKDYLKFIKEQK